MKWECAKIEDADGSTGNKFVPAIRVKRVYKSVFEI